MNLRAAIAEHRREASSHDYDEAAAFYRAMGDDPEDTSEVEDDDDEDEDDDDDEDNDDESNDE